MGIKQILPNILNKWKFMEITLGKKVEGDWNQILPLPS